MMAGSLVVRSSRCLTLVRRKLISTERKISRRLYSSDQLSPNLLTLRDRGLIDTLLPHATEKHFENFIKSSANRRIIYCGFDPTADSLHLGHLVALMLLLQAQRRGFTVIALVGGATAPVGDPSGRLSERDTMDLDELVTNSVGVKKTLQRIFSHHAEMMEKTLPGQPVPKYHILDNAAWNKSFTASQLASEVAAHLRLSDLLSKDSVRLRMEKQEGMSVKEFLYPLFQAHDWLHLYKKHGCRIQVGGNDQQGNIDVGQSLIRRATGKHVFGLTVPLLTDADGRKLGKSEASSAAAPVWLSPERTPAFALYQFLFNTADADVGRLLRMLTFRSLKELDTAARRHEAAPEKRLAQRLLAEEVTRLVHGESELRKAESASAVFFPSAHSGGAAASAQSLASLDPQALLDFGLPCVRMPLRPDVSLLEAVVATGHCSNESAAANMIVQGAVRVNQTVQRRPEMVFRYGEHILGNNVTLLGIGKKRYFLIMWHE